MKLVSDLYNKAISFKKDENGSILPITAILMSTLLLATGATIDYTRYSNARVVLNSALDAAVLDAGVRLGKGQPVNAQFEEDFQNFFEANLIGRGLIAREYNVLSFSANEDTGEVQASAEAKINTTFTFIAGFKEMTAVTSSGGLFQSTDNEVSIMLDVTGSMRGSKIRALRSAASEAIDILLPDGPQTRNMRVGLVPYASSVNAHNFARRATTGNNTPQVASAGLFSNPNLNARTNDCVTGRGGRDAATNTTYRTAPVGSDRRSVDNRNAFFRCPDSRMLPLTNQASTLKNEINGLQASGFTSGHLGLAWSYYMLSPQWNSLWRNQDNEAGPFNDDTNKIAILMTDGVFNTAYDGVGAANNAPFNNAVSSERSQSVAGQLCENMKTSGITVYTIAFELNDDDARDLLDNCATNDEGNDIFFYQADNEEELREAFRSIAKNISSLRLTQ